MTSQQDENKGNTKIFRKVFHHHSSGESREYTRRRPTREGPLSPDVSRLSRAYTSYFFGWKPERAAYDQTMFGGTYSFLPERYGIIPNTLHVILHSSTVALLAVLAVLTL